MNTSGLAAIFNSTSADFDSVTPLVWGPVGRALAAEVVKPGDRVLDVCAGTGASALAAAQLAGTEGQVIAVDFADELVARGRRAAEAAGLSNIDFRVGDVTNLPADYTSAFDVLTCGFGVFFLPDMDHAVAELLGTLRPGGRLAFAVWHREALYDFTGAFFTEIAAVKGQPPPPGPPTPGSTEQRPATRVDTVEKITGWLGSLGAIDPTASVLPLRVPRTDEFSWSMVLGSGLRGALRGLSPAEVTSLRASFLQRLADQEMTEVLCDTVIATARRGRGSAG